MQAQKTQITKLELVSAGLLVAALVIVTIAVSPGDSLISLYAALGIVTTIYFVAEVFVRLTASPRSSMNEPVPETVALWIKNTVSVLWLMIVAMFVIMLIQEHGPRYAAVVSVPLLAAAVGGRILQRRVGGNSLLSYSFTFMLALAAALAIDNFGRWK